MDYLLRRHVNMFTFQYMALTIQLVSQCIQNSSVCLSVYPPVCGSHES